MNKILIALSNIKKADQDILPAIRKLVKKTKILAGSKNRKCNVTSFDSVCL